MTDLEALRRSLAPSPSEPKPPRPKTCVDDPWTLPKAKAVVKARSGGRCELGGPECQGAAREVHHVYGRRGADPHHPLGLLDLCGHGNIDGCHGWVHQWRVGREAAEAVVRAHAKTWSES